MINEAGRIQPNSPRYVLRHYALLTLVLLGWSSADINAGELNFSVSTASIAENAATLTVSVVRTGDASGAASIKVSSTNGTAASPAEFTAVDTTLNWATGNSDTKTVEVTIADNATVGADKTFTLTLSTVTGDTIGSKSTLTITITDYEEGVLQFNGATFQASEDSKVARIKLVRTNGSNGTIGGTISFTDGTALKGNDYFGADTSVTIADGDTEATLEVVLKDDTLGEATESFTATLASPTGGATLGAQASATVEIFDTDSDFTTATPKIAMTADKVTQPDVVDLNQPSLLDSSKTYIASINEIPLLATSKLAVAQPAGGLVEIEFGNDKFYLRPTQISRNVLGLPPGVRAQGSNSYRFITSDGHVIDMQPAVASITTLQAALEALSMPNLIVTDQGNVTIQKDQGVPKIEENDKGELVLSDSFYDRWHIRAIAMVKSSVYSVTGIYQEAHPAVSGQAIVSLYFQLGSQYKVQYFSSAPANDGELEVAIRRRIGVTGVTFGDYGVVSFTKITTPADGYGARSFSLIADYTLTRSRDFTQDQQGFHDQIDVNGDGYNDYKMVYSNGDEQLFFAIPSN